MIAGFPQCHPPTLAISSLFITLNIEGCIKFYRVFFVWVCSLEVHLKKITILLSLIFGFILVPQLISAATIHVPGNAATIQAGIDMAEDGDLVVVGPGTYTGDGNKNLDYYGKAITIKSETGAGSCVIDCENDGRGFIFQNGETIASVLDGFTIQNGNIGKAGGLWCKDYSSPQIKNCIFINNTASTGSAVKCQGMSEARFENCQFIADPSVNSHTIEIIEDSNICLERCLFQENLFGTINIGNASAQLVECTIFGNPAATANYIDIAGIGNLNISDSTINDAVIYCEGQLNISNTTGLRMKIWIIDGGSCVLNNFTASHSNVSVSRGSCVCIIESDFQNIMGECIEIKDASSAEIIDTDFRDSNLDSSCVYCWEATDLVMTGCVIENFNSTHWKPLIYTYYTTVWLSDCIIRNNPNYNSGIASSFGSLSLENVIIEENVSTGSGGGIRSASGELNMRDCIIRNNISEGESSGGLFLYGTQGNMINCLIMGNSAEKGGGAYISSMNDEFFSIRNSTFVDNTATSGSGLYLGLGVTEKLYVRNSIFWNIGDTEIDCYGEWDADFRYCTINGDIPGDGNINADPLFTSGPNGDYYLSQRAAGQDSDSPCLDSGFDDAANICFSSGGSTVCMDTLTTRTDGVTDSGTVDMGYHYSGTPPEHDISVTLTMPAHYYYPGDPCGLVVTITNTGSNTYTDIPLFVVLDVYGTYYFYPSFTDFDLTTMTLPPGFQQFDILDAFPWPENTGSADGIFWYGAMTNTELNTLISNLDTWEFGWGE